MIEFREPSWYTRDVFALLERHRVTLCLHDMPRVGERTDADRVRASTCGFTAPSGRYDGSYPDDRLADWAAWLHGERTSGADVYAYFNNDVGGHAPRNALVLRRYLERATDRVTCGGHRMTRDQKFVAGARGRRSGGIPRLAPRTRAGTPSISAAAWSSSPAARAGSGW